MQAGFAQQTINPSIGCTMQGLGQRTPATAIRQDLMASALWLSDRDGDCLIVGLDLLFFDRPTMTAARQAISRATGLPLQRIMVNFTHNHAGPVTGTWAYQTPDPAYIQFVVQSIIQAAQAARSRLQTVALHAGMTRSPLPISRRKIDETGQAQWLPDPSAAVCDAVPVCVLRNPAGQIVSVLFSASCHPSSWYESEICGDFPGVAVRKVNSDLGINSSIFLQGCAGDTKPCTVAKEGRWVSGSWSDVERAGHLLADAVTACISQGLAEAEPAIKIISRDIEFPLEPAADVDTLKQTRDGHPHPAKRIWAQDMLDRLSRDGSLPRTVPIELQAIQLAPNVRLIALECEAVADIGNQMLAIFDQGVTFPLGYTNGTQLYLPSDHMLAEHGYEVDSYWEYHVPSQLSPGIDALLDRELTRMKAELSEPARV